MRCGKKSGLQQNFVPPAFSSQPQRLQRAHSLTRNRVRCQLERSKKDAATSRNSVTQRLFFSGGTLNAELRAPERNFWIMRNLAVTKNVSLHTLHTTVVETPADSFQLARCGANTDGMYSGMVPTTYCTTIPATV